MFLPVLSRQMKCREIVEDVAQRFRRVASTVDRRLTSMWDIFRLPSISQVLHLEIDYHSLKKQSIRAEVKDVAHMEEQLSNVSAKMEVRYKYKKVNDFFVVVAVCLATPDMLLLRHDFVGVTATSCTQKPRQNTTVGFPSLLCNLSRNWSSLSQRYRKRARNNTTTSWPR